MRSSHRRARVIVTASFTWRICIPSGSAVAAPRDPLRATIRSLGDRPDLLEFPVDRGRASAWTNPPLTTAPGQTQVARDL